MLRNKVHDARRAVGLLAVALTVTALATAPVSAADDADVGDGPTAESTPTAAPTEGSDDGATAAEDAPTSGATSDDATQTPSSDGPTQVPSTHEDDASDDVPGVDSAVDDVAGDDIVEESADATDAGEPAAEEAAAAGTGSEHAAVGSSEPAAGSDAASDGSDEQQSTATATSSIVQDAEVTDVQVAVSNTGGNVATGSGAATTSTGSVSISTGSASAVGNADQTEITQQAITTLSGEATAEIIQISIVVNIGGAYATSGSNAATSETGAGGANDTSTGSAIAVANDSETYITQAGSATAAGGQSDQVDQRVVTMQIGVATSDTGNNTIVATVSNGSTGAATLASGSATAVGNQSETEVEQIARAVGSGNAELTIEQWATIINVGVALANTGANQVGDMVGAVLAGPDAGVLEDLFAILLPALLLDASAPSDGVAPSEGGSGAIATGGASAVGNRSHTEVQQVAIAVASGDGSAAVRQDVVVVNAGAATANSGGNRTGAGVSLGSDPSLDEAASAVVTELAAFVADLLAQINAWADGTATEVESGSLQTQFGDWLIDVGGVLSASVGEATTADGVTARTRQLSAVFNLGVAIADTGNNVAITIAPSTEGGDVGISDGAGGTTVALMELAPGVVAIATGDASAQNSALIVVCQRANMADHPCLAPEEPSEEPPVDEGAAPDDDGVAAGGSSLDELATLSRAIVATPEPGRGAVLAVSPSPAAPTTARTLPATGGDLLPLVTFGVGTILFGVLLLVASRRRLV